MSREGRKRLRAADWIGPSFFRVFLAVGSAIWLSTPGLTDGVITFFTDFQPANVVSDGIFLPAPANACNHKLVYTAAVQFSLVFGVFEVVILLLRFVFHDSIDRKAYVASGVGFWFSVGFFLTLLINESIGWFGFVAGIVISGGLAIVAGSLAKLLTQHY